jgi:hypothetical protein
MYVVLSMVRHNTNVVLWQIISSDQSMMAYAREDLLNGLRWHEKYVREK